MVRRSDFGDRPRLAVCEGPGAPRKISQPAHNRGNRLLTTARLTGLTFAALLGAYLFAEREVLGIVIRSYLR